jgi:anti-sigma factor RsiW
MNCQNFLNSLHEYFEDSLSPDRQQAMDGHLTECPHCRQLLQQEQAAAQMLVRKFRHGVQHLTLPPDFQRCLLTALQHEVANPVIPIAETRKSSWQDLLWPVAIAACVLLTSFQSVRLFSGAPLTGRAQVEPVTAPVAEISVQYSFRLPTWKFRQEGNLVVDTLSYETVVASGTLVADHN